LPLFPFPERLISTFKSPLSRFNSTMASSMVLYLHLCCISTCPAQINFLYSLHHLSFQISKTRHRPSKSFKIKQAIFVYYKVLNYKKQYLLSFHISLILFVSAHIYFSLT
jgi:hypothetical protein